MFCTGQLGSGSEELPITDNCRACLSQITLYEVGMNACDAATRAIAKRVCLGDAEMSAVLIHQVMFFYLGRLVSSHIL